MNDNDLVEQVVQVKATVGNIVNDYINGMGGYAIADKYGLDTDKVANILRDADAAGKFIPKGAPVPIDKVTDTPAPIVEGNTPEPETVASSKKSTTKNAI